MIQRQVQPAGKMEICGCARRVIRAGIIIKPIKRDPVGPIRELKRMPPQRQFQLHAGSQGAQKIAFLRAFVIVKKVIGLLPPDAQPRKDPQRPKLDAPRSKLVLAMGLGRKEKGDEQSQNQDRPAFRPSPFSMTS